MFDWNILLYEQFEIFMKREFASMTRVFRLFANIFDINAILRKLVCQTKLVEFFRDFSKDTLVEFYWTKSLW